MLCYLIYLVIWTVSAVSMGLNALFLIAIAGGALQALWHYRLIRQRTREGCFTAFRLNHWLGFTVFAGMVAGLQLR